MADVRGLEGAVVILSTGQLQLVLTFSLKNKNIELGKTCPKSSLWDIFF